MEPPAPSEEGSKPIVQADPAPAELLPDKLPPKALAVRGRIFMPRVLGKADGEIHSFSQREAAFLDVFLKTFNLDLACSEAGIARELGRKYLKRGNVRKYLDEQIRIKALAAGTDVENTLAWFRKVRDGVEIPSAMQMEAGKEIRKMLQPSGTGGIQVNIQNNVGAPSASPFSGMTAEDLAKAMQPRAEVLAQIMKDRDNGSAGGPTTPA